MDERYVYRWPRADKVIGGAWRRSRDGRSWTRAMPEDPGEVGLDSRWPAFFPVSLSMATTEHGGRTALERISGASIVNRFPYLMAVSVCRKSLSRRHHARSTFMRCLEFGGHCALHFLPPGEVLDRALEAVARVPEGESDRRIETSGLAIGEAVTGGSPLLKDAYLIYEGRLAEPAQDSEGATILSSPWFDVGSHRIYFLRVTAIHLRRDIAAGEEPIRWRSLPTWSSADLPAEEPDRPARGGADDRERFVKGFEPDYAFPSPSTVRFESTMYAEDRAIRLFAASGADQVETDNDRARWPCFFPSSVGMITTWWTETTPNLMPCGSTTVVSRHPMVIAVCVSYARINQRYAPRATLELVRRSGCFGCGVPFLREDVVTAIRRCGTRSVAEDTSKVAASGLAVEGGGPSPVLTALPIHFDCTVVGEIRLGTHAMFLGEVRRIRLRDDVRAENPVLWMPWAKVRAQVAPAHWHEQEEPVSL